MAAAVQSYNRLVLGHGVGFPCKAIRSVLIIRGAFFGSWYRIVLTEVQ